jgi:lipoate-protein ligase A
MKYVDITLPTPAENLACDEALLEWCEAGGADEVLRFWEPRDYFVVVGYANHLHKEVNLAACVAKQVPVLRRCTGGGAVVQGPGCLNYSLILRIEQTNLRSITSTNSFVLERHARVLSGVLSQQVQIAGHSDLVIDGKKFSGNSQRRKHRHLLFHGTFLLAFDLALVEELLPMPSRQPDYRSNRTHRDFLTNAGLTADTVKRVLRNAWNASEPLEDLPHARIGLLSQQKYNSDGWNYRFR